MNVAWEQVWGDLQEGLKCQPHCPDHPEEFGGYHIYPQAQVPNRHSFGRLTSMALPQSNRELSDFLETNDALFSSNFPMEDRGGHAASGGQ